MSCRFCARHNGMDQDGKQVEQSQTTKDFEHFKHRDTPEPRELLSKKGLKTLHQNITGLLGKKPRICQILDAFKNADIFKLVERICPVLMRLRHRLMGSRLLANLGHRVKEELLGRQTRILIATLNRYYQLCL